LPEDYNKVEDVNRNKNKMLDNNGNRKKDILDNKDNRDKEKEKNNLISMNDNIDKNLELLSKLVD
jgi:hypothetical protein